MLKKNETTSGNEWVDPDDAPVFTAEQLADAELFHGDRFIRRGRGRPPGEHGKELISVRLDEDVLAELRKSGPGWQTRVNGFLRAALKLD